MGLPEPPPAGSTLLPADTFAGTTAIVTGAGTGLGRAIAVELARAGAAVGIISRSEEHRLAGVAAVEAVGGRAAHAGGGHPRARADRRGLRRARGGARAGDGARQQRGGQLPRAGRGHAAQRLAGGDQHRAGRHVLLQPGAAPPAGGAGRAAGAIVNILATQSFTGGPGMAHTAAAKAGVGNLTKSLAVEWAPDGIRVNALAPGLFPHEDMRDDLKALRTEGESVDARRSPAGRLGRLHELGWAVTWLCSPYASFVTGHTLVVDGANWLRRDFVMPEFTPVGDQLSQVLRPDRLIRRSASPSFLVGELRAVQLGVEAVLGQQDVWVPRSTMRPSSITSNSSASRTVERRCAMTSEVRPDSVSRSAR